MWRDDAYLLDILIAARRAMEFSASRCRNSESDHGSDPERAFTGGYLLNYLSNLLHNPIGAYAISLQKLLGLARSGHIFDRQLINFDPS